MPKGRRPQPTAVKAARGNPGKRKLNANEPKFETAPNIKPPAHLKSHARKLWLDNIGGIEKNGLATVPYLLQFEQFCILGARLVEVRKKIKQQGLMVTTRLGRGANPLLNIEKDTHKQFLDYARELGLTPAAASKVAAAPGNATKPKDPFTDMRDAGKDVVGKIG